MKAMILAAGRGERMMPLTANTPKPMLMVGNKPLIQHHIENLVRAGITDIVINYAWCGDKIIQYLGDGSHLGVNIKYSDESSGALETAGGIIKALSLLVDEKPLLNSHNHDTFLVINGDVFCQVDLTQLPKLNEQQNACLWLTKNPEHNLSGDFRLVNGVVENKIDTLGNIDTFTFSGIALYKACFFSNYLNENNYLSLGPLLRKSADQQLVKGIILNEPWVDVGTPERLLQVNECYTHNI